MSEARKLEDLDEIFTEEEEETMPDVAVLDDASAEYMLKRIREADEQLERMEAWYALQLDKAKAVRNRTVAWAERNLRAYFDMVPVKRSKTRMSYELPGGKLVLKDQGPKYDQDDEKLVPWLKANKMTDLVKVKESANWAELKKMLKETPDGTGMMTGDGEIVPGITVEQRMPVFKVTIK